MLARAKTALRRLKPFWAVHNLRYWPRLRANARHYRALGIRKPVIAPIAHADIKRPSDEVPWLDRPDATDALEAHPDLTSLPEGTRRVLSEWIDNGFAVLERYFDDASIDAANAEIASLMEKGVLDYHFRGRRDRVMNAFKRSPAAARLVSDPELIRLLGFILGREVTLFQTLDFFEGSEQGAHSDSFHMTTEPLGYLIAIWVALEDVHPDAGPVFYYPGSHRLPYLTGEDLGAKSGRLLLDETKGDRYMKAVQSVVERDGLEPVDFLARKGDVLVWHANLLHGGKPIDTPGATRRSLVAHYFATGVLCYHEVTERPAILESPPPADERSAVAA